MLIVNRVKLTTKKDKRFLNCNAKMWQSDNFCLEKQYTFQRFVWKNHILFSPKSLEKSGKLILPNQ